MIETNRNEFIDKYIKGILSFANERKVKSKHFFRFYMQFKN